MLSCAHECGVFERGQITPCELDGSGDPGEAAMRSSPLGVVVFSPEFVVGLVHEHAVLKEHDVADPPDEDDQGDHEEELPVGP